MLRKELYRISVVHRKHDYLKSSLYICLYSISLVFYCFQQLQYEIKTSITEILKFLHWQYIMLFSGKQQSHLMNIVQEIPAHHFSFVLPARFWFRSDECTQVNLLTDLLHVQQIIILNVARIVFSNIYSTAHENHIQVFVIALTIYFKYAAILVSKQHKSKLE